MRFGLSYSSYTVVRHHVCGRDAFMPVWFTAAKYIALRALQEVASRWRIFRPSRRNLRRLPSRKGGASHGSRSTKVKTQVWNRGGIRHAGCEALGSVLHVSYLSFVLGNGDPTLPTFEPFEKSLRHLFHRMLLPRSQKTKHTASKRPPPASKECAHNAKTSGARLSSTRFFRRRGRKPTVLSKNAARDICPPVNFAVPTEDFGSAHPWETTWLESGSRELQKGSSGGCHPAADRRRFTDKPGQSCSLVRIHGPGARVTTTGATGKSISGVCSNSKRVSGPSQEVRKRSFSACSELWY